MWIMKRQPEEKIWNPRFKSAAAYRRVKPLVFDLRTIKTATAHFRVDPIVKDVLRQQIAPNAWDGVHAESDGFQDVA